MMTLQRLLELAPLGPRNTRRNDWGVIEQSLGFTLPSDYKTLVDTYGPGIFGDFITVYQPACSNEFIDLASENEGYLWALRELKDAGEEIPYRLDEPSELVACGRDENGDPIFWQRHESDPDKWTIVVMEARGDEWFTYNGNLTEFLTDALSGTINVSVFPADFPGDITGFTSL